MVHAVPQVKTFIITLRQSSHSNAGSGVKRDQNLTRVWKDKSTETLLSFSLGKCDLDEFKGQNFRLFSARQLMGV